MSSLETGISKIIKEFRLPSDFNLKVREEAKAFPPQVDADRGLQADIPKRVDLRGEVFVTIDGETAKDFDDAVSVSDLPNGGYLLKVSIADVSHYVLPGTAIDQEAYRRGTSSYFPDRCLPMLPEKLSNDLCSLVPHEDRLTFTAEMAFDAAGRRQYPKGSRFYKSVIRSLARLTYTQVRKILTDKNPETRSQFEKIVPDLERMERLAEKIRECRSQRGSLDFDLPEPLIELDFQEADQPQSGVEGEAPSRLVGMEGATRAPMIARIVKAERNVAHRLIEEFMIAANEAVAEFITENDHPMIYRVHGEPDPEKVLDFKLLLHNLGFSFRFGKKLEPSALASVIEAVRGKVEEKLVNTLLLRTMRQAVYDARNIGHFGLASKCYTHFTSPIRRYPDLVVHRVLGQILEGQSVQAPARKGHQKTGGVSSRELLQRIAVHASERERNSMKAEWASRDLATAIFMQDKVGERLEGIVAGVTKFGFFVELSLYYVQGLVSLKNLRDDYYVFHEKTHLLVGRRHKRRYQIGTPVCIRVRGVNLEKRWVDFEIG